MSETPETGVQAARDEMVASLAELLAGAYNQVWTVPTHIHAVAAAEEVWAAGWRRVVEDDDTIERLAELLWTRLNPRGRAWSGLLGGTSEAEFRDHARVVVRALRNEERS